jgi:FMN phosphatase YigB (HAD superfamily)
VNRPTGAPVMTHKEAAHIRPCQRPARTHMRKGTTTASGRRAVVFDLYETLVTEFAPGWREGPTPAERLRVPLDDFDRVWRRRKRDRMTRVVDYRDVLREACSMAGYADHWLDDVIEELHTTRLAAKAAPIVDVEPSILESLGRVRGLGLRIGLISNCSVEEVAAWDQSPLAALFDGVVFSYDVGHAKPEPAIYRLACQRLGVAPEETAFVGDGGSDELAGAARVGMSPYCARWFLDRWPAWRRGRTDEATATFPQLTMPADLLAVL